MSEQHRGGLKIEEVSVEQYLEFIKRKASSGDDLEDLESNLKQLLKMSKTQLYFSEPDIFIVGQSGEQK